MYDLLVKHGTVIDPSQGLNDRRDVTFENGKVTAIAPSISDSAAASVIDATGLIVTPGLVDLHVHVYPGVSHYGIEPDPTNIAKGVTTAVDAGSAGSRTFPAFRRHVLEQSDTRLLALLNISSMGMISPKIGELEDIRWADIGEAIDTGRRNRDFIIGIKARLGHIQAAHNDQEALKRAIQAADVLGGFVMIHVGNTSAPLEEMVNWLRPGDVVTHVYHGHRHGILDNSGRLIDGFKEAQERGVVFDIGHGAGSFSFDVAEKALSQGFMPGNISSDLHIYNIEGPVHDQVTTISKFLHLGLPLSEVVRLTTESTARTMNMEGKIGTLRPGAEGDATLLRLIEGSFTFTDSLGVSVQARQKLDHALTIKAGRAYKAHSH
jgi:dihydroorotase